MSVKGINIESANERMRTLYHAAGHTGRGVVVGIFGSGVNLKGPLADPGVVIEGNIQAFIDHNKHDTSMAWLYRTWLPLAQLISYQVFPDGKHNIAVLKAALRDFIARAKADRERLYIGNLSLSGKDLDEAEIKELTQQAKVAGVVLVCSGGNTGVDASDTAYPGALPWVTTVTWLKRSAKPGTKASTIKTADYGDYAENVPVMLSTGKMGTMSGASVAVAFVGCKIGLVQSCYHDQTGQWWEIERLDAELQARAVDVGEDGWDDESGYGVILGEPTVYDGTVPEPEPEEEEETPVSTDRCARLISAVLDNMELMLGTDYSQDDRNEIWPGGHADCSSLVAAAWSTAGFPLLNSEKDEMRTSYRQVSAQGFDLVYPASRDLIGKNLPSPSGLLKSYAQEGDIIFWNFNEDTDRPNKITHVGMIYRNGLKIIHTANKTENCCTKSLTYGDGDICAIIRLRADFSYPALPDIYQPDGTGRADEWLVRMLQTALNFRAGTKLVVDGSFGSKTAAAVLDFNKTIGLYSAMCTAQTWAALGFVNNGDTVPVPEPEPEPEPAPAGGAVHAQTMGTVRLRKGPGTEYDSVGTSGKDAPLLCMPALDNGWRETAMEYSGHLQVGYMSGKYIAVKED